MVIFFVFAVAKRQGFCSKLKRSIYFFVVFSTGKYREYLKNIMTIKPTTQMTLDFQPGLAERFTGLLDCMRQGAYTHRNPLKTIAADMDMSQSDLSRKLSGNPEDPRRMSVDDFEKYLQASGDMTPIYYLVEKYLADHEATQRRAAGELARQLPDILALIKAATLATAKDAA